MFRQLVVRRSPITLPRLHKAGVGVTVNTRNCGRLASPSCSPVAHRRVHGKSTCNSERATCELLLTPRKQSSKKQLIGASFWGFLGYFGATLVHLGATPSLAAK